MACKSIISHIQAQAEKIISQHEQLEASFVEVVAERDALLSQVRQQEEQIRELRSDVKRLQLAMSLGGNGADKSKSRARINLLLREVDKCIALLTKAE